MTLRLFLLSPAVVFAARVNMATIEYPLDEVTYDGVTTGAYTDIRPGMTVLFGTTAGADDLGRQRIRKAPTSDTLYIGISSANVHDGEVLLQDDAYITVLDDRRVWAKIPYIDDNGVVQKDADTAFQPESPPVSNVGAPTAGTVDPGTGKLRVQLPHSDANSSFATEPGATIASYGWDLPAGVSLVSGYTIADAVIEVDCDPGFYYVACTVTDSNGRAHHAHVPILAIDPDDDPTLKFQVESHRITPKGQELSVRILEDAPAAAYPDGTVVLVWEGEPASPDDRSHMRFYGWHQGDENSVLGAREATLKDTTLTCLDVAGRLDMLPGFPQSVEANDTPTSWLQMANPNMDRYLHYLLYWHSSALELADWTWSGTGNSHKFVVLGSDGESLWNQVNRRAEAMTPDHHLVCNRLGQMAVVVNPMLQEVADRTSTVQATLTESDWREIRQSGQRPPRYHWHRRGSIVASWNGIAAVFCVAPGKSPGQGLDAREQDEKLTPDQETLNRCEGHRYARMNAPQGYWTIVLAGSDDKGIEPADYTWVQLTTTGAPTRRGVSLSNARGLVHEVNISYDQSREGLTRTVELLWEEETSGPPAHTYTIPDSEIPHYPYDPIDPGTNPSPGPSGIGTLLVLVDAAIDRTGSASAASPIYTGSDLGPGGVTYHDLKLDPWDPEIAYVAASDGLYKSSNWLDTNPVWTLVLSAADILTATGQTYKGVGAVVCSIHQQDYVGMFYAAGGTRAYFSFSDDGGATWTTSLISSNFEIVDATTGAVADRRGGFLNILYAAHNTIDGRVLFKSTDRGATWSVAGTMANRSSSKSTCVHVPYEDNTDGDIVYIGLNTGAWRTTDGGASFTALPSGTNAKGGIGTYTGDRRLVYHWRTNNTLWVSDDAGDNWIQRGAIGLSGTVRAAGGFPSDPNRLYALTTDGIFVSHDRGATFRDKTGDWLHDFTIAQYWGGTIVPLWTE